MKKRLLLAGLMLTIRCWAQDGAPLTALPSDEEINRVMQQNKAQIDDLLKRPELQSPSTGYLPDAPAPRPPARNRAVTQPTNPANPASLPSGVATRMTSADVDRMLGRASPQTGRSAAEQPKAPPQQLMLFASLSMPEGVLREMARQAAAVGGVVILRGMVDSSLNKTAARAAVFNRGAKAEWMIHPDLFKQMKIDRVPAWALAEDKIDLDTDGCVPPGHYAVVFGDVSASAALDMMIRRGPVSLRARAQALRTRLEGRAP